MIASRPSFLRCAIVGTVLVSAVATGLLAATPAAAATPVTYCSAAQPVKGPIPGDLVVSYGQVCDTAGEVPGNVLVRQGGRLINPGEIHGNLRIDRHASASFDHGAGTDGYVVLDHAAGFYMSHTLVGGNFVGSLEPGGAVFFDTGGVIGRIALYGTGPQTEFGAYGLEVYSDAIISGMRVALQVGLDVEGSLTLEHTYDGPPVTSPEGGGSFSTSTVCGGTVHGNLTLTDASGSVQLGAGPACGAQHRVLTVLGSLLASGNQGSVIVGGHYTGDAICQGNVHHPRGDGRNDPVTAVQVDGARRLQCANLPRP